VGQLTLFRVLTGTLRSDSEFYNVTTQTKERTGKLFLLNGKEQTQVTEVVPGDLAAMTKLKNTHFGDTIAAVGAQRVEMPKIELPTSMVRLAIVPKSRADEDKLGEGLNRLAEEDPTFTHYRDKDTGEHVVKGMGDLQLEILLDRMKRKYGIEVETKTPKVAFKETIKRKAEAQGKHKKQTGGHGQYARVSMEVNPIPRGEKYRFTNAVFGGAISKGYIPGIEKGIIEAMEAGDLAGYPVVDVEARIVDGKEHPVDSSELAFKLAARGAFRECVKNAKPVLLEPVCNLTVFVDEQYLGAVLSDLSGKRGKVQGQNPIGGGILEIKAQVPQAELMRYAIDLKALTASTGSFELGFDHYSPISGRIAEDVIKAAQAAKAEEKE